MIGEQDELLGAAVDHAVAVHGHEDSAELREQVGQMLEPADAYQAERSPA
jgi:cystathionine beta-lyase/cystathionine gamma-synthase